MVFRNDPTIEVVAFTATQIPNIEGRLYPPELAGPLYPKGIPIFPESELQKVIEENDVDRCIMSYSDLPHSYVMHMCSRVNALGPDFMLLGGKYTRAKSSKPVIAVVAVRTGCGKSQASRFICSKLRAAGKKVVAVRHPMPYGNLVEQKVQRMASMEDIDRYKCTIEEREEYEKHVEEGGVIYAGVDYEAILRQAEAEADIVLWDGGNNDTSFFQTDLSITIADPLRPGHEESYYPGETNVRNADVIVINKCNVAKKESVNQVLSTCQRLNPKSTIVKAHSVLKVDKPELLKGKRVLAVEDGPTLTHGEMEFGAGVQAARECGASELVDPRPWAVGSIAETFAKYPKIGTLLPAMGYWPDQIADLEKTINNTDCDVVVIGTPFNLLRLIKVNKPVALVTYEHADIPGEQGLEGVIDQFLKKHS